MKKLLRRMMVIGCLVVTCMSVTGCWNGDEGFEEVTGTENEELSFNEGVDFGKKTADKNCSDEDVFNALDRTIKEHPGRICYDLYLRGYVEACIKNGRTFKIEGNEQSGGTYFLYLYSKYQMRCDEIDDVTKHMSASTIVDLTIKNMVPEFEYEYCGFSHQKNDLLVYDLRDENREVVGKGYYDLNTHKVSYEMNNK